MWIAHSRDDGGWLSIVSHRHKPEFLMVRARVEEHITSLWPDAEIYVPEGSHDYQYRADILREDVGRVILEYIVSEIRYDDFKPSVNDWDLRRAFVEIWGTMAEYFGTGYGYE